MISDWDCLANARNGDEAAWQRLIERHHPRLIRMTFLITGSMHTAQDLVQETFIRLLRLRANPRGGCFSAYLSRIAFNLALKEKKRIQRNRTLDDLNPVDKAPTPLEALMKKERDRCLAKVIGSLEENHRHILVLRFYGGHSYEEIARITNLPLGTVKSRIFYAVKQCRKGLHEKGIIE